MSGRSLQRNNPNFEYKELLIPIFYILIFTIFAVSVYFSVDPRLPGF